MNKSVLISIQPKWCALIASGKKTIEVRKTAPKLETPFKCYIYCTKQGRPLVYGQYNPCAPECYQQTYGYSKEDADKIFGNLQGKVIGEFMCDNIDEFACDSRAHRKLSELGSCLTEQEIRDYCGGQTLYGWHISDLKIYDNPKELDEFRTVTRCKDWQCFEACSDVCGYAEHNQCKYGIVTKRVFVPPQSWCYIEEPKT